MTGKGKLDRSSLLAAVHMLLTWAVLHSQRSASDRSGRGRGGGRRCTIVVCVTSSAFGFGHGCGVSETVEERKQWGMDARRMTVESDRACGHYRNSMGDTSGGSKHSFWCSCPTRRQMWDSGRGGVQRTGDGDLIGEWQCFCAPAGWYTMRVRQEGQRAAIVAAVGASILRCRVIVDVGWWQPYIPSPHHPALVSAVRRSAALGHLSSQGCCSIHSNRA